MRTSAPVHPKGCSRLKSKVLSLLEHPKQPKSSSGAFQNSFIHCKNNKRRKCRGLWRKNVKYNFPRNSHARGDETGQFAYTVTDSGVLATIQSLVWIPNDHPKSLTVPT